MSPRIVIYISAHIVAVTLTKRTDPIQHNLHYLVRSLLFIKGHYQMKHCHILTQHRLATTCRNRYNAPEGRQQFLFGQLARRQRAFSI